MQTANIMLALAGDSGNTIPKYGVTPAEIAVLRLIHGAEAVYDVEPVGEVPRQSRAERNRLVAIYGKITPDGQKRSPAVDELFPGAAARVFERLEELDIPAEFYKATSRVGPETHPLDHDGDGEKGGSLSDEERASMGLDGMTKKELVAYAEEHHVEIDAKANKPEILAAVKESLKQAEPEAPDEPEPEHPAEKTEQQDDGIGEMSDEKELFG